MDYGKTITVDLPFEEALPAIRAAFKEQGFGIRRPMTPLLSPWIWGSAAS